MTIEAPERIWAATFFQDVLRATAQKPIEDVVDICGYQEYIRADLAKPTVNTAQDLIVVIQNWLDLEPASDWGKFEQALSDIVNRENNT